jgi:hypothetical protein
LERRLPGRRHLQLKLVVCEWAIRKSIRQLVMLEQVRWLNLY